jgi:PleD family two-component response regulator
MTDVPFTALRDAAFWSRVRTALTAILPGRDGRAGELRGAGVEEALARGWALAQGTSLTLMVVGLDRGTEYFTAYGAETTEACMIEVLGAIDDQLVRPGDMCVPLGQSQALLVLPGLGLPAGRALSRAIRESVRGLGFAHKESHAGTVTVSVGLALVNPQGHDDGALFDAAAAALTRAQRKGLRQLVVADLRSGAERRAA